MMLGFRRVKYFMKIDHKYLQIFNETLFRLLTVIIYKKGEFGDLLGYV
jgi:hypothetical protein